MTEERPGFQAFRYVAKTYLSAQCPELGRLKDSIARNPEKPWTAEFRRELGAIIDDGKITRREYETLTSMDFDTDDEYFEWLRSLWSFLYDGGPDPS